MKKEGNTYWILLRSSIDLGSFDYGCLVQPMVVSYYYWEKASSGSCWLSPVQITPFLRCCFFIGY